MKKWLCVICGLIYDEAEGWPDDDIAPGTRWEDVPDDWTCPDCGVGKEDFEMIEMEGDDEESAVNEAAAPVVSEPAIAATPAGTSAEAPVVIIGSGYAGYGLAEAVRKRNADVRITLFTQDDGGDYSKPGLSNAMARGKTAAELLRSTAADIAQRHGIEVNNQCQVFSIDADEHSVISDQGELHYSKLVLATGAEPVKLPLAGEGAADMLSVNSLTDYRVLRERLDSGAVRKISIIGNGLVGCEYANELITKGYEVSVIGLTYCLDTMLPETISRDLESKLAGLGVNWYLENTVNAITKAAEGYELALSGGQTLEADLVLSCVGLRPRTELALTAGIDCKRGIVVDNTLQTSVQDIYALGDCTEIQGQVLPYIAPITHGLKALPDTVLGTPTEVHYPPMPVVVKTPVLPLLILPAAQDVEGEWQVEDTGHGMRGLFRDAQQKVRGFALSGDVVNNERQQWLDAVK